MKVLQELSINRQFWSRIECAIFSSSLLNMSIEFLWVLKQGKDEEGAAIKKREGEDRHRGGRKGYC